MFPADSSNRSRITAVLNDLGRWFFSESLLLWALANGAESRGHLFLRDLFYFVLWISAAGVFIVKLYPLVRLPLPLTIAWLLASIVIAFLWFPQLGSPMPNLFAGTFRFLLPLAFTVGTIYSWYRAFHLPAPTSQPHSTAPATSRTSVSDSQTRPAMFSIRSTRYDLRPLPSHMWYVDHYPPGHNRRRTMVSGGMLLVLTNLKPTPLEIEEYNLEKQDDDGRWRPSRIAKIAPFDGKIYYGKDLAKVAEVNVDSFNAVIQKGIPAGETVRGWIFLKDFDLGKFRLAIREPSGKVTSAEFSQMDDFPTGTEGHPVRPPGTTLSPTATDISGIPEDEIDRRQTEWTVLPGNHTLGPVRQDQKHVGVAISLRLRLLANPASCPQYIFDIGQPNQGRLSLYLSTENELTLAYADADHPSEVLPFLIGHGKVVVGEFVSLSCEIAVDGHVRQLRLSIDGRSSAVKPLLYPPRTGALDVNHGVIGTDLSRKHGAAFDLAGISLSPATTLAEKEMRLIANQLDSQPASKAISFNGERSILFGEAVAQFPTPPQTQP